MRGIAISALQHELKLNFRLQRCQIIILTTLENNFISLLYSNLKCLLILKSSLKYDAVNIYKPDKNKTPIRGNGNA